MDVDLMDMSEYAKMMIDTIFHFSIEYYAKNSGVSFILVVIDTCVWALDQSVTAAFQDILQEGRVRHSTRLRSDKDKEFLSLMHL